LIAITVATSFVACKSDDVTPVDDPEWRVHGGVDPESLHNQSGTQISGTQFLEMNGKKEGVVVLPSGLQYRELQEGNGVKPGLEDSVVVHYKMINLQGEVDYDSRKDDGGKPQSFRVAKVIGGWREALLRMPEGSKWKLYVPPDLGYGSTGVAGISSNETLIYEIELFRVKSLVPDNPDENLSLDPLE